MEAELELDATKENLKEVFDFVTTELSSRTDDKKLIRQIKLCVEEIFLNISSYAYHPEVGRAKIMVKIEGNPTPVRIWLSFIDHGHPFDPLAEETPDTEAPIDKRKIGGLGIFLVRNTVDGIKYEYINGENVLTIFKEMNRNVQGQN
ncbi:MAG: ATP-binding protein [Eubacterium sp.]|nr:ATP-binding protein [Eubacterium sp.]